VQLEYTLSDEAVELLHTELPQLAALERQLLQEHSLATSSQEDSEGQGPDGAKDKRTGREGLCLQALA
jgi:hypothetical protein